jgi:ribulose-phosphate 3-epimerase
MKTSISFMKSLLSPKETIQKIDRTDANYIHVDVMDGKFTKNKGYTIGELKSLLINTTKQLDIHLMVKNPLKYIDELATLNVSYFTFHYETVNNPVEVINYIKNMGIKAGIALKPKTKVKKISNLIPCLDLVLVMGVEPGKGGQELLKEALLKLDELNDLKSNNNFFIALDGGINDQNIDDIYNKKVDIIVSGSFVTISDNYQEQLNKLKK